MKRAKKLCSKAILIVTMILCLQISNAIAEGLTKADNKYTCMVNNTVFDKVQIPTEVEGSTYYGCCAMCASKLANDATVRKAIDPVSGKEVDKAVAIIGGDKDGKAYYFENEKNLQIYAPNILKQN